MTLRPTDFLTHHGFRRRALGRVRSLECATALAARQSCRQAPAVHSLHLPTATMRCWIGSALPRNLRGFADFDGIQRDVSTLAAQLLQVRCVYQFRHRGCRFSVPDLRSDSRDLTTCRRTRWDTDVADMQFQQAAGMGDDEPAADPGVR